MKKLLTLLLVFCGLYAGAQHAFFIGVKSGVAGDFVQYKNASYTLYGQSGLPISAQARLTSQGLTVPLQAELVYGYKKLRIGYQFEYMRTFNSVYSYKLNTATISNTDTSITDVSIRQNYFCHSLLFEYILYENKYFRFVPGVSFGLFHGNSDATIEPFDQTILKNKFKVGVSLNAEVVLGRLSLLITPQYNMIRLQNFANANQSGFAHVIGLQVGLRFNCIKPDNPDAKPLPEPEEDPTN
ncbi:MAG: hypothetical protein U0T73_06240 [Chitinophagales bacterium]